MKKIKNSSSPAFVCYYKGGNINHEEYCINGVYHNENGPAVIVYFENGDKRYNSYYIKGQIHNENGPARLEYFENGNISYEEYHINGKKITKELFNWHKQNNVSFNNITSKQKILRKLQIGY